MMRGFRDAIKRRLAKARFGSENVRELRPGTPFRNRFPSFASICVTAVDEALLRSIAERDDCDVWHVVSRLLRGYYRDDIERIRETEGWQR